MGEIQRLQAKINDYKMFQWITGCQGKNGVLHFNLITTIQEDRVA